MFQISTVPNKYPLSALLAQQPGKRGLWCCAPPFLNPFPSPRGKDRWTDREKDTRWRCRKELVTPCCFSTGLHAVWFWISGRDQVQRGAVDPHLLPPFSLSPLWSAVSGAESQAKTCVDAAVLVGHLGDPLYPCAQHVPPHFGTKKTPRNSNKPPSLL